MNNLIPVRLEILNRLEFILSEIEFNVSVNGINTLVNLDGRIFRGTLFSSPCKEGLPRIGIIEPPEPFAPLNIRVNKTTSQNVNWSLLVQGVLPDNIQNPSDPAYELMALVRQKFAQENYRGQTDGVILGFKRGFIKSFEIGTGVIRPADEAQGSHCMFYQDISISFEEDLLDIEQWRKYSV